ncbi:MAG: conserved phage C-terminal domain-containing protein [Ruminococcus sp.]|nr:conserved phage C-terminal domain-containing protein [Ruminococcus sp.]
MNHDLLEQREEDSYFMTEVPNVTGSESYSAERMRRLRSRASQCDALESHCDKDVRSCDEEKEIEKRDKIKDKRDKIEENSPAKAEQYSIIISYLNEKVGTNYKSNAKSTQKHINARLSEGYTVDDFKTVIDFKCSEWLNDKKMKQYLRPETLFGTKFESYLNNSPKKHEEHKPNILDELF